MSSIVIDPTLYPYLCLCLGLTVLGLLLRMGSMRRDEARHLEGRDKLERHIVRQHRDVLGERGEAAAWRLNLQHQTEALRATLSRQLEDTQKHRALLQDQLAESLRTGERRQLEHQVALQMCAELPSAKSRALELEKALVLEQDRCQRLMDRLSSLPAPAATPAPVAAPTPAAAEPVPSMTIDQLPILPSMEDGASNAGATEVSYEEILRLQARLARSEQEVESLRSSLANRSAEDDFRPHPPKTEGALHGMKATLGERETELGELRQALADAQQRNAGLQRDLTVSRLKARALRQPRSKRTAGRFDRDTHS